MRKCKDCVVDITNLTQIFMICDQSKQIIPINSISIVILDTEQQCLITNYLKRLG